MCKNGFVIAVKNEPNRTHCGVIIDFNITRGCAFFSGPGSLPVIADPLQ